MRRHFYLQGLNLKYLRLRASGFRVGGGGVTNPPRRSNTSILHQICDCTSVEWFIINIQKNGTERMNQHFPHAQKGKVSFPHCSVAHGSLWESTKSSGFLENDKVPSKAGSDWQATPQWTPRHGLYLHWSLKCAYLKITFLTSASLLHMLHAAQRRKENSKKAKHRHILAWSYNTDCTDPSDAGGEMCGAAEVCAL